MQVCILPWQQAGWKWTHISPTAPIPLLHHQLCSRDLLSSTFPLCPHHQGITTIFSNISFPNSSQFLSLQDQYTFPVNTPVKQWRKIGNIQPSESLEIQKGNRNQRTIYHSNKDKSRNQYLHLQSSNTQMPRSQQGSKSIVAWIIYLLAIIYS